MIEILKKLPLIHVTVGVLITFFIFDSKLASTDIFLDIIGFSCLSYFVSFMLVDVAMPIYKNFNEKRFKNSFDYLPPNQQNILWKIYCSNKEQKAKMQSCVDLIYLKRNQYIELIEKVSEKEAIYQINKKLIPFLTKKLSQQIIENLQSLSDKEKDILNLFYDGNFKEKYDEEDKRALESLIDKKIIERKNEKLITPSKYANKILQNWQNKTIKYSEVELGKFNIYILPNTGGGARGGL